MILKFIEKLFVKRLEEKEEKVICKKKLLLWAIMEKMEKKNEKEKNSH